MAETSLNSYVRGQMFRFAGAVAALLLSIALSYGIVRYAVRDFSVVGGPGVETLEMAREVRGLSNALAFWANDFFSRFPPEGGAVDPDARRWAGQVLAPQYDELREQAVTADFPHPVWRDLVAAVYRCGYVLREPANEAARKQTAVEVRTAIAQAESWILEEKLDRYLPAAQQPFRF